MAKRDPTLLNQYGAYFPWHSRALDGFQNLGEGICGLATPLRVDPPGGRKAGAAADAVAPARGAAPARAAAS